MTNLRGSDGDEISRESSNEANATVACIVVFSAAFKVLVASLQNQGVLKPGQISEGLGEFVRIAEGHADQMTLMLLDELRQSLLD